MLRITCCGDSSKAKYRQRSFRLHASYAKLAAILVFPVPAVPETRILLPLKKPPLPSILLSAGIPVDTIADDTGLFSTRDVIGKTEMPSSSIRNGYSLVPC